MIQLSEKQKKALNLENKIQINWDESANKFTTKEGNVVDIIPCGNPTRLILTYENVTRPLGTLFSVSEELILTKIENNPNLDEITHYSLGPKRTKGRPHPYTSTILIPIQFYK